MSQFKVGDVVQRVKLPHYVGVVVKLPEMWGDDKKQSYIVAPIGKKRNDTFFAEDLKPYPYKTVPASGSPVRTTGDLVTFSLPDSYGHNYDDTFYVGPREDMRVIDGCWLYPYINWEDRQTYYGGSHWGDVKKVVKPKLKIGDFVRLAGKASSPVVKIIYDRPYKTHVYTLENELFVSETRLTEFVFDEKDKSWSHKDVKPVAKAIEKTVSTDDIKVGDVVLDRRVDCSKQLGVVIRAEHPRYTVNWLDQDCVEKLVYRGSLQLHLHNSTPNDIAYRRPNSVLVVQTGTGKEFYQIGTSEAKIIDGTWYFPYVNLHTTELRYGNFHYKRPGEVLTPKFKLGDLIAWYASCEPFPIVSIDFNSVDREFLYELKEGHRVTESALRLFVQAQDKVWRCELDLPPNSESKPYKAADEKLYPKFSIGDKLFITDDLGVEQITAVFFDVPTKKFSYCINESWGYIFEEYLDTFKKQGDTWYHPSVLEQKEKIAADCETADLICNLINIDASSDNKPTALVTNPELAKKVSGCKDRTGNVFVFGKEEYVGNFFKYTTHKIGPGIGNPKVVAELDLSEPSPNEPSDAFLNVYAQIKKDFVENPDKYGPRIILDPKAYREAQTKYPTPSIISDIVINKIDLPEPSPSVKMCTEQVKEWRKQWPPVEYYDNPYVACIEYANNHITKTLLKTRKAHENVMNCYGMPIKDILAPNSVKDTEPKGVKMNLSPVNARVIRLRSVRLLDSLSKKFFLERFPDDVTNFKIVGNLIDSKVPAALVLSLASFSCKYGLPKAPTSIKPIVETLQKEFTEESEAMLTNAQLGVLKLIGDEVISSLVSLVKEHVTDNDI